MRRHGAEVYEAVLLPKAGTLHKEVSTEAVLEEHVS